MDNQTHFFPFVVVVVIAGGFFLFFLFSLPFTENSGLLTRASTAAARAALPSSISVCRIFVCPNNGVAASV